MGDERGRTEEVWSPGEVVGFCPVCRDQFYVPHGGKCPADHDGAEDESPYLIEYVPRSHLEELEANRDKWMKAAGQSRMEAENAKAGWAQEAEALEARVESAEKQRDEARRELQASYELVPTMEKLAEAVAARDEALEKLDGWVHDYGALKQESEERRIARDEALARVEVAENRWDYYEQLAKDNHARATQAESALSELIEELEARAEEINAKIARGGPGTIWRHGNRDGLRLAAALAREKGE